MATQFKSCSVDGCNGNSHYTAHGSAGMCRKHYAKLQRHGDPMVTKRRRGLPPLPCSIEGCDEPAISKGFCHKHYERFRKHGDPLCVKPTNLIHGLAGTRLYGIWVGMKTRCGHVRGANPTAVKHYIEKGIRVCVAWQDFAVFAEWAKANGYADNLTIDRIDARLGYEPANCRWLTMADNLKHRHGTLEAA